MFSPNIVRRIALGGKFSEIGEVEEIKPTELELTKRAQDIAFLYWQCGLSAREVAKRVELTVAGVRYQLTRIRESDYLLRLFGKRSRRGLDTANGGDHEEED